MELLKAVVVVGAFVIISVEGEWRDFLHMRTSRVQNPLL